MIELPQLSRPRRKAPAASRPRARWYRIENRAEDDSAEIFIYDAIAWYGTDVNELVAELQQIRASTLHVRINSPGGDVFDGVAIYNALVRHSARVIVHVDGLAASIASVIAMAGDEIRMHEGSFLMIHDPWMLAIGPSEEMRAAADLLDKVGHSIAGIYERRSGLPRDEITDLMTAETWLDADEAREKGFADAVDAPAEKAASPAARFDLSAFEHPPERLAAQSGERRREPREKKTPGDAEQALCDAGFPRRLAKGIVACGFKATTSDACDEPDGSPDDAMNPEVLAEIEEAITMIRLSHSLRRAA